MGNLKLQKMNTLQICCPPNEIHWQLRRHFHINSWCCIMTSNFEKSLLEKLLMFLEALIQPQFKIVCIFGKFAFNLWSIEKSFLFENDISLKEALHCLTHFQPMFHLYTPWKHQKMYGFLMFSGSIEVEHWLKMD